MSITVKSAFNFLFNPNKPGLFEICQTGGGGGGGGRNPLTPCNSAV